MERNSQNTEVSPLNSKNIEILKKKKSKITSFLSNDPISNFTERQKKLKKSQTPLKTGRLLKKTQKSKENMTNIDINPSKLKITRFSTFKKKLSRTKVLKNNQEISLKKTSSKIRLTKAKSSSKSKPQFLKAETITTDDKTIFTSPPAPKACFSQRTPDSIRLGQRQNPPIFTEKKIKIPEIGYFCKRISLFDKTKSLYIDHDISGLEKQNPHVFAEDLSQIENFDNKNFFNLEEFCSVKKNLNLYHLDESPESNFFDEDYFSPDKAGIFEPSEKIELNLRIKVKNSLEKEIKTESITENNKNSKKEQENTKNTEKGQENEKNSNNEVENDKNSKKEPENDTLQDFLSPTKIIQVRSPETNIKKHKPHTPKKNFDFDSPGSFNFSLSSNSSDEKILEGICYKTSQTLIKKDEEIQTDLGGSIKDTKILLFNTN